jgi:hypothetical protein
MFYQTQVWLLVFNTKEDYHEYGTGKKLPYPFPAWLTTAEHQPPAVKIRVDLPDIFQGKDFKYRKVAFKTEV